jgi:uncharacterized protein YjbI with pentapeptide repeats
MTTDAEDRSTWPRNGKIIRRKKLLRLIEKNRGPDGLDLKGAVFAGDLPSDDPEDNPIDLSPDALAPLADAYRNDNGGREPPWLSADRLRLWGAQLQGAVLRHAQLEGADLRDGHFQKADLTYAQLQNGLLYGTHLQEASLLGAQLQGAQLFGARLQGTYLWEARLQQADLRDAHLQGAELKGAQLQRADLRRTQLDRVDMYDVASVDGAHWYGALLDHTRIKRESLGKAIGDEVEAHQRRTAQAYRQASEAYLSLKNNFNQIGRYEDASWAYVKEQQMEKMAHYREWRSHGWQVWRAWGSFWRWLRNWAYELATGYGERPWNPVVGGVLMILGFAGGFWVTRAVANFWDALIYSIATFATFNLADAGPTGRGADVASSVEALLGIAVLALVVFTLGNKMSRG